MSDFKRCPRCGVTSPCERVLVEKAAPVKATLLSLLTVGASLTFKSGVRKRRERYYCKHCGNIFK